MYNNIHSATPPIKEEVVIAINANPNQEVTSELIPMDQKASMSRILDCCDCVQSICTGVSGVDQYPNKQHQSLPPKSNKQQNNINQRRDDDRAHLCDKFDPYFFDDDLIAQSYLNCLD